MNCEPQQTPLSLGVRQGYFITAIGMVVRPRPVLVLAPPELFSFGVKPSSQILLTLGRSAANLYYIEVQDVWLLSTLGTLFPVLSS